MRKVNWAVAAIVLGGCAKSSAPAADTSAGSTAMAPAADTAIATAAVAKLRNAWADAANRKDAATVAAMYSDNAVFVSSDQPVASGRAAIQAAFAKTFPISSDLKISSEKTEASGDLAYDYGTYTQRVTPPKGKAMEIGGNYLVVLRKQSDGSWKIVRHVGTTPPKS